jgi:hypothetical protein
LSNHTDDGNRTKKIKYLEENLASLDVKITPGEEAEIREAINCVEIIGGRYPEM